MYCQTCGKQIEDGSKFCPYCGSLQETVSTPTLSPNPVLNEEADLTEPVVEETVKEEAPVPEESAAEKTQEVPPVIPAGPKKNSTMIWVIAIIAVAAIGLLVYFVGIKGNNSSSTVTPNPPVQETVTVEEPEEPKETVKPAEHDTYEDSNTVSSNIRIEITAGNIKIRDYPSTKTGNHIGKVSKGQTYEAYEYVYNEGYTWYRIGDNQWIADQNGEWIKVLN